ncbi:MAG: YqgE/AlgH family protein [Alphaproteobacteria bacterium]|nr:YqgE/AlgH family protein [Alphaproteobacteria bacterium]
MTLGNNMHSGYLAGQMLVAMPGMTDPRFERSVIYLCVHNEEGAMGLILNQLLDTITFNELLDQLDIPKTSPENEIKVHFGGPVEAGRGFVLHSSDYARDGTVLMEDGVGLTATIDVLRDISNGTGPQNKVLALGYAGWGPGQLDSELQENAWLTCPAKGDILFDDELFTKWDRAMTTIGIDPALLSGEAGHC